MSKQKVINFIAGPSAGKTTYSKGLTYFMGIEGLVVEEIPEYAKDKTWENAFDILNNQIYVFGKQQHRNFRVRGQVDLLITDGPLLNSIIYDKTNNVHLRNLILQEYNSYDNLNFFINRSPLTYRTAGRTQTFEQAVEIDNQTKQLLIDLEIPFIEVGLCTQDMPFVIERVKQFLNQGLPF